MRKAIDIIGNMISTKQYKMDIKILELFSQYRSFTGHEISKLKVCKALHITSQKYDYIVAGSTSIKPKIYIKMIKYLSQQCDLVNPKYKFIIHIMSNAYNIKDRYNENMKHVAPDFYNIHLSKRSSAYRKAKKASNYEETMSPKSKYAVAL